jgi:hypothetical protein
MDLLLQRPREAYFGQAKNTHAKHKACSTLSEDAYTFFKVFLEHKALFEKPVATAQYRPYDILRNKYSQWPKKSWGLDTWNNLSLGVVDFRSLPGIEKKDTSTVERPYFFEVVSSMKDTMQPAFDDVPSWLFICGDEKEETQVIRFIETDDVLNTFSIQYSVYTAGKFDRLLDLPAAKTPKKVFLIFLQSPASANQVKIPAEFNCPETPRYMKVHAYSELEYRIHNTELRMEFYLWLVKMFAKSGQAIFSGYTGGKLTCAAVVSFLHGI